MTDILTYLSLPYETHRTRKPRKEVSYDDEPSPWLLCRFGNTNVRDLWVEVYGTDRFVHGITIDTAGSRMAKKGACSRESELASMAEIQIRDYLAHSLNPPMLPLWRHKDPATHEAAMDFLRSIPLGETRTYAQQAAAVRKDVGGGFSARCAGNANRRNRYPLVIPCHRVVRTGGDIGGFMGSRGDRARAIKTALLVREGAL